MSKRRVTDTELDNRRLPVILAASSGMFDQKSSNETTMQKPMKPLCRR